ncbi:hypothetical protein KKF38_02650, partial [Patescibacteria group bacterium]|nr:hypothetical protein [Patescibacteria group bacterium]
MRVKKNNEVNPPVNWGVNGNAGMSVKAFAKINLGLRILRKREDGFHEIDTIFAKIGLHDSLEFTSRNDSKIILVTEGAWIPKQKNLVFRAAWLLQKFSAKPV